MVYQKALHTQCTCLNKRENYFNVTQPCVNESIFTVTLRRTYFRNLKVPKCEIFDRSDFPDFYTIKSLRVGDFGVKIIFFFQKYLWVHLGVQSSLRV